MAMEDSEHLGIRCHHLVLGMRCVYIEGLVRYQGAEFLATEHNQVDLAHFIKACKIIDYIDSMIAINFNGRAI